METNAAATIELSHSAAMDAIEAAFTAKATDTAGVVNFGERARNTSYAAHMLTGCSGSYCDAVDALARRFTTPAEIAALPGRALRARA